MNNFADRVKETSTTTGTGDITLAGAVTGCVTFSSVFNTGDRVWYCIDDGTNWEVGFGTLTASTTLNRTDFYASSTGSPVSFSAGSKNVFVTISGMFVNRSITRGKALARITSQEMG